MVVVGGDSRFRVTVCGPVRVVKSNFVLSTDRWQSKGVSVSAARIEEIWRRRTERKSREFVLKYRRIMVGFAGG